MGRLAMMVLWPSFLVAIVAEGMFFSFFNPDELAMMHSPFDLPPLAIYTIGFFCFWVLCAVASSLSFYLSGAFATLQRKPT